MPSYRDLQVEAADQHQAWEDHLSDLQSRAQELCFGFRDYLDPPVDPIKTKSGGFVPCVDLGRGEGRSFEPCSRFQLVLNNDETISFTVAVNIEHRKGLDVFFYEIVLSQSAANYGIQVVEPPLRFNRNVMSGPPDLTELYDALSNDLLQQLRRRP